MAIDQSQLLQMLLQGGGGGTFISPTSGLQDPSLSGLALGPQGMGLGGGGSLLGGGGAGFGGGAGGGLGGLDLSQLLAQLQAAPGVTDASLGTGIGAGSIGGFGAGGQMGQEATGAMPTPSQQGQAGLGSAGTAAQFLSLLKEGTGLAKTLTQLFPKGAQTSQVSDINSILVEMGIQGTPFVPTASAVSGASGGSIPSLPFDASQALPFQIDPAILSGASGGGLVTGGVGGAIGGPQAISAPFLAGGGPESVGQVATALAPEASFLGGLGGLQGALGGAGVLSNLGFGALNLAQGNTGAGLGGLLGTGGGLALGAALAPETAGLSLLLGGIGGGTGGLLGGLFGGGGPSADWLSFAPRLAGTLGGERQAASDFVQAILNAQTPQNLEAARQSFLGGVEASGVGGFATRATPGRTLPELPGATGTAHEGGQLWNPNAFNTYLDELYSNTLAALQSPGKFNLGAYQQGVLPLLQQALQVPGGNTFGTSPSLGLLPAPMPVQPPQAQVPPPTSAPTTTVGPPASSLNLPGSPDPDLLALLQRMGVA